MQDVLTALSGIRSGCPWGLWEAKMQTMCVREGGRSPRRGGWLDGTGRGAKFGNALPQSNREHKIMLRVESSRALTAMGVGFLQTNMAP